jgi:iron complex transport system substrate-binding protein
VIGDEMTAPTEAIDQLRAAGIPVVILPTQTTLEGVSTKIRQIAEILSAEEAGEELVQRVEAEIAAALTLAESVEGGLRVAYVYVRGPQLLLLFGRGMATNAMITGAGAVDAGAESGVMGVAPLTPEALVAATPDVIVLPEAGLQALGGVEAFAALPGVADTPAGRNGALLAYDEAFFFNLGPRAGQALEVFVRDLYPELAGS